MVCPSFMSDVTWRKYCLHLTKIRGLKDLSLRESALAGYKLNTSHASCGKEKKIITSSYLRGYIYSGGPNFSFPSNEIGGIPPRYLALGGRYFIILL